MSWIKVRTNLSADPRVIEIGRLVGITPQHTVGALVCVWSYADEHSTDGVMRFVDDELIDKLANVDGFATAMRAVEWLDDSDCGNVRLPRFEQHNGETAKSRANGANRQARYRVKNSSNACGVTGCNGDSVTGCNACTVTRGEEIRVDKRESARPRNGGGI